MVRVPGTVLVVGKWTSVVTPLSTPMALPLSHMSRSPRIVVTTERKPFNAVRKVAIPPSLLRPIPRGRIDVIGEVTRPFVQKVWFCNVRGRRRILDCRLVAGLLVGVLTWLVAGLWTRQLVLTWLVAGLWAGQLGLTWLVTSL